MNKNQITICHNTKEVLLKEAKEKHNGKTIYPCGSDTFDDCFTVEYMNHHIEILFWYDVELDNGKGRTSHVVTHQIPNQ